MTRARTAREEGLRPHYKVRVVLPGVLLHFGSLTMPTRNEDGSWNADWIEHPNYGDTIGYIDWSAVIAVTWRYAE